MDRAERVRRPSVFYPSLIPSGLHPCRAATYFADAAACLILAAEIVSSRRGAEVPLKSSKDKILVVDDDASMRFALATALRGWGYDLVEAGTVAEGLRAFEAEEPSAVLLDIDLPDGSGLDALREIKSRRADAVVIMITGKVLVQNTVAALRGGAYDFIAKPPHLEELRVTIRNGLEAHQLRG